jgi:hypothetical protein
MISECRAGEFVNTSLKWLISEEKSQMYETVFESATSFATAFHCLNNLALMKDDAPSPKGEKIF